MIRNPFEEFGRAVKVERLLAAIEKLPLVPTPDEVAAWPSTTWSHLTSFANALFPEPRRRMAPPSAVTRALVVEALRARELSRCLCFVPPAGPGVPHEAGCPLSRVVSLADARARRRAS